VAAASVPAPQNAPQFITAAKYLWRLHTSKLAGLRRRQSND
jgi:hypothetical protein